MNSPHSNFSVESQPQSKPKRIPRLESLQHRLEHAKDADGQPIPLRDELLFFLESPPPGTGDRWQAGADLCAGHGIKTSRMSVWRFHRANILEWRRAQAPALPARRPSRQETARLQEMARHLAAQRALDMLGDPGLAPGHLVGFLQNENHRQQIQLARDQFDDRLSERRRVLQRQYYKNIEERVEKEVTEKYRQKSMRENLERMLKAKPNTTS